MYVYQLLGICFYIGEFYDFIGLWTNEMDRIIVYLFLMGIGLIRSNDSLTQDFYWRDYSPGDIPYDAFRCNEGKYIGQVLHASQILPATIYPHSNIAVAELYGRQDIKENIKILCTPDSSRLFWERVNFDKPSGNQMENVVKGGYIGINLFIGKIFHEDEWKIGKVAPIESADKGIHVWNRENKWVSFTEFFILKYNFTTPHYAECKSHDP